MPSYSESAPQGPRKPSRIVVLTPSAFADGWADKPDTAVAVGLRLISDGDAQVAKASASQQAERWYTGDDDRVHDFEGLTDAYNDGVMRHCIAMAACDVNDITVPYFHAAEDTVREALTPEGVARLFEELQFLHAMSSLKKPPADNEECARLGRILTDGRALDALESDLEIRKMLAHCLSALAATGVADPSVHDGPTMVRGDDGQWIAEAT